MSLQSSLQEFLERNVCFTINISISVGLEHKMLLLILIITHTNGDMSHFARVNIFNSDLCMTDVFR